MPNTIETPIVETETQAEAVHIPMDGRGATDQRRANELLKMWDIAPAYDANKADTPLDCPDPEQLDQQTLESTYSQAKVRFLRSKIRPALVKKSEGLDDVTLAMANTLGDMFKAEAKAQQARYKKAGSLLEHSEAVLEGVKAVSATRQSLKDRVCEAIDNLLLAAEVGYGCKDVNFKGMSADEFVTAVFATQAGKTAARSEAATRSAK